MKTQFTLSLCLLAALVIGCGPAAPSAQVNEGLASPQIVAVPPRRGSCRATPRRPTPVRTTGCLSIRNGTITTTSCRIT